MESNNFVHTAGTTLPEFTVTSTTNSGSVDIPELTFGQKLVGLTFNSSGDDKVLKAKKLCAELADMTYEYWCRDAYRKKLDMEDMLFDHTIGQILNAQMNVVKLLTFNK